MARDLSALLSPIAVAPEPGLASVDPRLAELDKLGSQDKYDVAANQIEALIAEGIYDIRPLSYYLYQAFREGGIGALRSIFEALENLLGPSFEAIGPANRRVDHFNKRLGWLFEKLTDSLEYHEKKATPEWDVFHKGLTAELLEQAIGGGERVIGLLAAEAYASAGQRLARLVAWLRRRLEIAATAIVQPAAPAEASAATSPARAAADPSSLDALSPPVTGSSPALASGGEDSSQKVELAVSHRFIELGRKLKAFEALIEKKEFEKAALVADDLMHVVEHFDPREYFPDLFARFGALFSKNIGQLAGHWEQRSSAPWKALQQFYRVDLKGFISS